MNGESEVIKRNSSLEETGAQQARCRKNQIAWVLWFMVVFGQSMGVWIANAPYPSGIHTNGDLLAFAFLELEMVVLPFVLFVWTIRAEYIAAADGLHWRDIGQWYHAPWESVTDYYNNQGERSAFVEISYHGKPVKLRISPHRELPAFREVVQRHALNARVTKWQVYGTRPEVDWWRTFEYNARSARRREIATLLGLILWLIAFLYMSVLLYGNIRVMEEYSETGPTVFTTAIFLVSASLFALLFIGAIGSARDVQARASQRITASPEGIIWEDGHRRVEAPWEQVRDYYCDLRLPFHPLDDCYIVVTENGEFNFSQIEDRRFLMKCIEASARSAAFHSWRERTSEEIRWGKSGERHYNYRGRDGRAVFFAAAVYCSIMILNSWPHASDEANTQHSVSEFAGLIISAICLAVLCWAYRVIEIRTDENGITRRGFWNTKTLRWQDITVLRSKLSWSYQVVAAAERIVFGPLLRNIEILHAEIERKAKGATIEPSWTLLKSGSLKISNNDSKTVPNAPTGNQNDPQPQ